MYTLVTLMNLACSSYGLMHTPCVAVDMGGCLHYTGTHATCDTLMNNLHTTVLQQYSSLGMSSVYTKLSL